MPTRCVDPLLTRRAARSLDEGLHTRQGPVRTFLILARYCTRTVYQEQLEKIREHGSFLWPGNLIRVLRAWSSFMRVELKLSAYEFYLALRRMLGFRAVEIWPTA
jgi:aarF domain-containing kinase